jgi:hypothetical protein
MLAWSTLILEMHMAFKIPYRYDYIKLCRKWAEVIQNLLNPILPAVRQEAMHRKLKRLKLGGGQAYDLSSDLLTFWQGKIS